MAHKALDRVKEAASTSGTGAFTLAGAASGFRTFASQLADADTTWYCAVNDTQWEVGLGTKSGAALQRTTVLATSVGTTALVNFTAAPTVFATLPASALNLDRPALIAWKNSGTAQAIPANATTAVLFPDVQVDTHASYTAANGQFKPKVAGYYQITAGVSNNNQWTGNSNINIRKNGATFARGLQIAAGNIYTITGSALVYLNGSTDYADVGMFSSNGGQVDNGTGTFFHAVLVATPSSTGVAASAFNAGYVAFNAVAVGAQGPFAANTDTKVLLTGTKDYDPDNVFDSTNSRFTAPIAGVYELLPRLARNNPTVEITSQLRLYKNGGAAVSVQDWTGKWTIMGPAAQLKLSAGDYIELYFNPGADAATSTTAARLQGALVRAL